MFQMSGMRADASQKSILVIQFKTQMSINLTLLGLKCIKYGLLGQFVH